MSNNFQGYFAGLGKTKAILLFSLLVTGFISTVSTKPLHENEERNLMEIPSEVELHNSPIPAIQVDEIFEHSPCSGDGCVGGEPAAVVEDDSDEFWHYVHMISGNESVIASIEPCDVMTSEGNFFVVAIKIWNVTNLRGWDIGLTWNPEVLNLTAYKIHLPEDDSQEPDLWVFNCANSSAPIESDGNLTEYDLRSLENWNNSQVVGKPGIFILLPEKLDGFGRFRLVMTLLRPHEPISGDFAVVSIVFQAICAGETKLDLYAELINHETRWIPSIAKDGNVTVAASK